MIKKLIAATLMAGALVSVTGTAANAAGDEGCTPGSKTPRCVHHQ